MKQDMFEKSDVDNLLQAMAAYIEGVESGGQRATLARGIQAQIEKVEADSSLALVIMGGKKRDRWMKRNLEIGEPIYPGDEVGILREATEILAEGVKGGQDQAANNLAKDLQMIDRVNAYIVTVQRESVNLTDGPGML